MIALARQLSSVGLQTIADGEAEQAENKAKHLRKQLQEQKKLLGSKDREASKLQADLGKEQQRVDAVNDKSVLASVYYLQPLCLHKGK